MAENRRSGGILFWKLRERGLAVKLWGSCEVTRVMGERSKEKKELFKDILTSKNCGEEHYLIFSGLTREFIGGYGLIPYDAPNRTYIAEIYLRKDKGLNSLLMCKTMLNNIFNEVGVRIIFTDRDEWSGLSEDDLERFGLVYIKRSHYRGIPLDRGYYVMERR